MSTCKELLKDLEYYCMVEDGLESKKNTNRKEYNFNRIMEQLENKKQDEKVKISYNKNISKAKALVDKFDIVHNTSLESIIGIIQQGALLSVDEMEKRDISFNFRISIRGINDEMHKYVFASTHQSDAIYGLYEIKFKRAIETINGAQFTPSNYLEYGQEVLKDYFMDIKNWRKYLAEYIATTMDELENYLKETPVHLRPEFLFPDPIQISDFESITCINGKACSELVTRIKKEFGEDSEILKIIKSADE